MTKRLVKPAAAAARAKKEVVQKVVIVEELEFPKTRLILTFFLQICYALVMFVPLFFFVSCVGSIMFH